MVGRVRFPPGVDPESPKQQVRIFFGHLKIEDDFDLSSERTSPHQPLPDPYL